MMHIYFRRPSLIRPNLFYQTLLLLGSFLWLQITIAQTLPIGFKAAKAQSGYDSPMGIVFSADGKQQFVWEKNGKVWVSNWNGSQYIKQNAPALDISEEVGNWRDFGLASFCLDPNFGQNGRVYLFYMVDRHHLMKFGTAAYSATTDEYYGASISRVTRYQLAVNNGILSTVANSRQVLLGESRSTGIPLVHESHAGGTLQFARDGSLLLTTGDNASYSYVDKGNSPDTYYQQAINDGIMRANENVGSFRSQMLNSHCGKLLRMDPNTGNGLPSNPYFDSDNPRSAKSRVWALGLRNPFRMSIMPNTGSTNMADGNPGVIVIGDVGWNVWEDLHVIRQGGENAGWPIFEGLEIHQDYASAANTLENRDEPNPSNTCNKPYLTFADLIRQPANPVQTVMNPCSGQPLPGLQRRYIHARPVLDWKHGANVARTPSFSNSIPTVTSLGASGGASGTPFGGNCAAGGAYYNGASFPTEWRNTYFFADFGANWIKAATFDANTNVTQVRDFVPAGGTNGIVDLEFNSFDGGLYYVNINTGDIMKVSYGGNQPPIAVLSANTLTGQSPLTVSFKGDGSTDPNGDAITYAWNFGDGTTSTQANPTKVFSGTGTQGFTVTLTVSDGKGLTDTKTVRVSLNNSAPTVAITSPAAGTQYPVDRDSQYTLTARVNDEDASNLTYAWQVTLRHNTHEHREPVISSASPTITLSPVGCDGETYYYFIQLTVTDKGGLTATDSIKIFPDCNSAKLAISNLQATVQANTVQLNWTAPPSVYDNVLVVAKAGSGFSDRPTKLVYTADANFSGSGAEFFGGKVVYQGVANTLTVTNLPLGQKYYFRVYTRRGSAWTGGVETSAELIAPTLSVKSGSCYRIVSRSSGKVLGGEGNDNGSAIRQRTDANLASQQWKFTLTTDGYYQIISQQNGKVIDVTGVSVEERAQLTLWDYLGGGNQQWKPVQSSDGYTQFIARHSGKAIDLLDGNQSEGAVVAQFTPNATTNQQWRVEERSCVSSTSPVPLFSAKAGSCYRLVSRASGKVLTSDGTDNGTAVTQRTDANLASQQWKFAATSDGYYQIISQKTGKVFDQVGNLQTDRGPLGIWNYAGGNNQQWKPVQTADGYTQFLARHSGKAIDLLDASQSEGAVIGQFTPNGGTNQQWLVDERSCVSSSSAPIFSVKSGSCYRIVSRSSGKVLGSEGSDNGSPIRQRTDANLASQQWKFTPTTDGYYQIVSQTTSKVIDVTGISMDDRAQIILWDYLGGGNQQWKPVQSADGYTQFIARHSGKAIDLLDGNQNEGAVIAQFPVNANTVQQWLVEERSCVFSPTACYKIASRNGGRAISVPNGATNDGVQLRQLTYAKKASQQWKIQADADGYYKLVNGNSGKVIDVYNNLTNDLVNIIQWPSTGQKNQQWKITPDAQGYYVFTARHSGKVMDQKGSGENEDIIQWSATGGQNQQWTIDAVGCSAAGSRLGANELLSTTELTDIPYRIYPNPAETYVNVDLQASQGRLTNVSLTDLNGKTLYHRLVDTSKEPYHVMPTDMYAKGVYLLSIDVSGNPKTTLRLLIGR
ncbi:RICIN domain-containing protein [Spirosoma pomorum]